MIPKAGGCVTDPAARTSGTDTPSTSGEEVIFSSDFDDDLEAWDYEYPGDGGESCRMEDGVYYEGVWLPDADTVFYCYLTLDRPLDVSAHDEAWIELDYDVEHYADAGGPHDAASIGFELSDGDAEDWQVIAWSQSEGEDAERSGRVRADLGNFAGWSEDLSVRIRLAMYACPDLDAADCGYRRCCDDIAWIAVDDFEVIGG